MTRGLLPLLEASGAGDIVNIVSISGLPNVALHGASVAFLAAKHGQTGMTDGLRQELQGRPVRVTGVYPPNLEDVSPLSPAWNELRPAGSLATNRDVVETVLHALSRPRHLTPVDHRARRRDRRPSPALIRLRCTAMTRVAPAAALPPSAAS